MRQFLFTFFVICACFGVALGDYYFHTGIFGPMYGYYAYSAWTDAAVPVASFAASGAGRDDCHDNPNITSPVGLCGTPSLYGQAVCTNQVWTAQDMDLTTATIGANCWYRRTHVRVDDKMIPDTGSWYLKTIYTDTDECLSQCARQISSTLNTDCPQNIGAVMFLPRY